MDQIRVGIVGAGVISTLHLRAYNDIPEARVEAVCDLDADLAAQKAQITGTQKIYTDYRRLLDSKEIDAVEVITPQQYHREITLAALDAGKHVSVQKPMANNMQETTLMTKAAEHSGRIARIYENFRFYPAIDRAKTLVDAGEIGEPLAIHIKLTNGIGGSGDFSHDQSRTWDRRMDLETSGGGAVTFDHGYHVYNIARVFLGGIESVFAYIGGRKDKSGYVWDSPAAISWKHKGAKDKLGMWQQVWCDELWLKTKYYAGEDRIEITGDKGIIWITKCTADFLDVPPLIVYKDGRVESHHDLDVDWQASFTECTRNFIQSIRGECPPEIPFSIGREVQRICTAVVLSGREKRIVPIDEIQDA